jgi:TonB family protein
MKKFVAGSCVFIGAFVVGHSALIAQESEKNSSSARAIDFVDAVYPKEAKATGFEGSVFVRVNIDRKGRVTVKDTFGPNALCAFADDPRPKLLRDAAIAAAKATVFEPSRKNGRSFESDLTLKYDFEARPDSEKSAKIKKPLAINAGVVNGKAKSLPKPEYPAKAKARRASGSVVVSVVIDTTGKVTSAGIVSGHPDLREAATSAACRATFTPTLLQGQPVIVNGTILYTFNP